MQPPATKLPPSRAQKTRDFWLGYVGWFVLNGLYGVVGIALAWFLPNALQSWGVAEPVSSGLNNFLTLGGGFAGLVLNLGGLAALGASQPQMALGATWAFATALVLALCAAMLVGVGCFFLLQGMSHGYP